MKKAVLIILIYESIFFAMSMVIYMFQGANADIISNRGFAGVVFMLLALLFSKIKFGGKENEK